MNVGFQPPCVGEEEIAAVADCLRSGWLATGPRAALLEERLGEYLEAEHVVTVASGTAALHLTLVALGIGPGDEVITTPFTWPATAQAIVHAGATPVFVDVREQDLNIDPLAVAFAMTPRTKAILPVHLAGQPCRLDKLDEYGLPVIEDAAHALEASFRGMKIGGWSSDAACFSLGASKNVTAGQGGLVATDDGVLAGRLRSLRWLGVSRTVAGYEVAEPGFRENMPDLNAAIALAQLEKLELHRSIRIRHVAAYDRALAGLPGLVPLQRDPVDTHALHLYIVRVDPRVSPRIGRDELRSALAQAGIQTGLHYRPVHELAYYRNRHPQGPLPIAEAAGEQVFSLPLSPAHSDEEIAAVIAALEHAYAELCYA